MKVKWRWKKAGAAMPRGNAGAPWRTCHRRPMLGCLLLSVITIWMLGLWWLFASTSLEQQHPTGGNHGLDKPVTVQYLHSQQLSSSSPQAQEDTRAAQEPSSRPQSSDPPLPQEQRPSVQPAYDEEAEERQRLKEKAEWEKANEIYRAQRKEQDEVGQQPAPLKKGPWNSLAAGLKSGAPLPPFDFTYKKGLPRTTAVEVASAGRRRAGVEGRRKEQLLQLRQSDRAADVARAEKEWSEELHRFRKNGASHIKGNPFDHWYMKDPALVVLAYNRPGLLESALASLNAVKGISRFKLYVSQHGNDQEVERVIDQHAGFNRLHLGRSNDSSISATQHIAQHYQFALETLFVDLSHSHVVVVEDDMTFAPDFAIYFEQLAHLLDMDPTLWCISSWNDNGFQHLVEDPERLFRTSYFPGLGWMLNHRLWEELRDEWPDDHWDHWMRHSGVSRGRECVAPEVSRNYNVGEHGSNMGADQFARYFKRMKLNDKVVFFTSTDHLLLKNYQRWIRSLYSRAEVVKSTRVEEGQEGRVLLLPYARENYGSISLSLALWDTPTRGTHNHSLVLRYKKNTLLLADKRHCAYLPESLRISPHEQLRLVTSAVGEDCHAPCAREGLKCHQGDFDFLRHCEALASRFPCHRGRCQLAVGPEMPIFLPHGPHQNATGRCLVSEDFASCAAKHKGGQRLCPCIPRTASAAIHPY